MVTMDSLREALHANRREVHSRGHQWDVADVMSVIEAELSEPDTEGNVNNRRKDDTV